jgi:general secretion pathway protein I
VRRTGGGFTLVEVLVALMVVAIGLAALMTEVSGAARSSGILRDKTIAEWIALNRITEVRLTVNKLGENTDKGEVSFANRTWHYDTRYFDTPITSMKRIVVRVWAGDTKTKGNPLAESTGYFGAALATPGGSNIEWTMDTYPAASGPGAGGNPAQSGGGSPVTPTSGGPSGTTTPGTGSTGTSPTSPR